MNPSTVSPSPAPPTIPAPLCVALVGMSGAGKSLWSRRLAAAGFRRYDCDRRIGRRLAVLAGIPKPSLEAVGRWMGRPADPGYRERAQAYLDLEEVVLNEILDELAAPQAAGRLTVIDTTGSVIYTAVATRRRLRRTARVVHLASGPESRQRLLAAYLRAPRPVLWHGHFSQREGESEADALARCYPLLMAAREDAYGRMAHLRLDEATRSAPGFDAAAFRDWVTAPRAPEGGQKD